MLTKALLHRKTTLVVVNNHGDPSIGTKLGKPRLFLNVLSNVDSLPGKVLWRQSVPARFFTQL
jgi:hypothetical protein